MENSFQLVTKSLCIRVYCTVTGHLSTVKKKKKSSHLYTQVFLWSLYICVQVKLTLNVLL